MLEIQRNVLYAYVTAVVDMCCTMNGGITTIDRNRDVEPQLISVAPRIRQYPNLSSWVETSLCNWEQAQSMTLFRCNYPRTRGMYSEIWYMSSPDDTNDLQRLDYYQRSRHPPPSGPFISQEPQHGTHDILAPYGPGRDIVSH